MSEPASTAHKVFGDIAPALADYTDPVLFADVWERPGLSPRDRSLVTVSSLVAPSAGAPGVRPKACAMPPRRPGFVAVPPCAVRCSECSMVTG
ncbi:carboxymuconolactone decarboxylase family protein [Pseudomonas denitrificans (nom. rej.)]|nr:carboxymuconolactone decarboxylase family protein [Pseudomonas denitrificans (nom. rej.)]